MLSRLAWRLAASFTALLALLLLGVGIAVAWLGHPAVVLSVAFIVGVLLSAGLAARLGQSVTAPVGSLTRAMRRLALGEPTEPIMWTARDEVGGLARAFNDMRGALRSRLDASEAERRRLATVLSHMGDGVAIVGRGGVVQLANPAATRLLRLMPSWSDHGPAMAITADSELASLVSEILRDPSTAPQPRLLEFGPVGRRRAVQAVVTTLPGGAGAAPRALLILQDVTELRRAETARRDLVANISHDLRTPIAALKALVETLEDGAYEDPAVARDFLGRMHVEVDGLAQLISELLELSRIESGQFTLERRPTDLGAVVAAAAGRLRVQAERDGIALTISAGSHLPDVELDPDRIGQVVVNLVHNALKFTPPGGRVDVRAERRGGEAVVTVADTGVGISPEVLPRLFERFYKVDKARSEGGGTGLGLAIAKHLVQAHGGRVWAESPGEGRGATFGFALPLGSAASNA